MLMMYATFIGISILLSSVQIFKSKKQDNKPTKEQVEAWAREYNLLEAK